MERYEILPCIKGSFIPISLGLYKKTEHDAKEYSKIYFSDRNVKIKKIIDKDEYEEKTIEKVLTIINNIETNITK